MSGELASKYASTHDEMLFYEVSAKNGSNISESFENLAQVIQENQATNENDFSEVQLFEIDENTPQKSSMCCCKFW